MNRIKKIFLGLEIITLIGVAGFCKLASTETSMIALGCFIYGMVCMYYLKTWNDARCKK